MKLERQVMFSVPTLARFVAMIWLLSGILLASPLYTGGEPR
jgi:hypothetical protein